MYMGILYHFFAVVGFFACAVAATGFFAYVVFEISERTEEKRKKRRAVKSAGKEARQTDEPK